MSIVSEVEVREVNEASDRTVGTENGSLDKWQTWGKAFDTLCQRLLFHFGRSETRCRVPRYLLGLLSIAERKNSWQLAGIMHDRGPQGIQRLLNSAHWDAEAVRDELRAYFVEQLGHPSGVLVLDETGFPKKGCYSAGVTRQYSGTAGRIENQQIGVFLTYASPHGAALIDRALYLPEEWTKDPARCRRAKVPGRCTFASKPLLVQQMLEHFNWPCSSLLSYTRCGASPVISVRHGATKAHSSLHTSLGYVFVQTPILSVSLPIVHNTL